MTTDTTPRTAKRPRRGRPAKYTPAQLDYALTWAAAAPDRSIRQAAALFEIDLGTLNRYARNRPALAADRWAREFAVKILDGLDLATCASGAGIDPDHAALAMANVVDLIRREP